MFLGLTVAIVAVLSGYNESYSFAILRVWVYLAESVTGSHSLTPPQLGLLVVIQPTKRGTVMVHGVQEACSK